MTLPAGLLDLPTELLERILFHVADPTAIRAASRTCTRLAAAAAAPSPLWPALLAGHVDLTPQPGPATGWDTDFYCYWDGTYGGPTDTVAFAPPLSRVRGWTGGKGMAEGGGSGSGSGGGGGGAPTVKIVASDGGDAGPAVAPGGDRKGPKGGFLYTDNRRADGGAPPAPAANDARANGGDTRANDGGAGVPDGGAASPAAKRPKTPATAATATAAAAAAVGTPAEEDPRLLYAAVVAATRAGDAVADRDFWKAWSCSDELWGSGADLVPRVWVVRLDPPGIPWPPPSADATDAPTAAPTARPPAAEADVLAGAAALLTAAGAAAPVMEAVAAKGTTEDVRRGTGSTARVLATSGDAGGTTYTRVAGEAMEACLREDNATSLGLQHLETAAMCQRVTAANGAVRGLLGDRPALLFTFGDEAMNPVGGVLAVAWSPTLVAGLLVELVR